MACQATEETMKKRIYRCSALYVAVAAYAVAVFLLPISRSVAALAREITANFHIFKLLTIRVLYYNIAITGNAPADPLWPAGSSFVVLLGKKMAIKTGSLPIIAALLLCALLLPAKTAFCQDIALKNYAFQLKSSSAAVRLGAIYDLAKVNTTGSLDLLASQFVTEKDQYLRQQIVTVMDINSSTQAFSVVRLAAKDKNPYIRRSALGRISSLDEKTAVPEIASFLAGESDSAIKMTAVGVLSLFKSTSAVEMVDMILFDTKSDKKLRLFSVAALEKIGTKEAVASLVRHSSDTDADVRGKVNEVLGTAKKNNSDFNLLH